MSSPRSQHHEDPDALLLLHAAGELTENEASPIVAMLAADPALQARFEQMRDGLETLDRQFAALDACDGLRSEYASKRAVAAIRDWQLGRSAVEVVNEAEPVPTPSRRPGMRSAVAAVVAVGIGLALIAGYVQRSPNRSAHDEELPETIDSNGNPLALHAATSLAVGPEPEDDAPPAAPMPPTAGLPLVNPEQPFFDIPLIADAD